MRNILMLLFCVFFPLQVFGNTGDTIKIAAGLTVEPYIIESNDSGFEADIVKEIFAMEGYNVQFVYQPLKRTKVSFKNGTVDAVMTIKMNYPEVQDTVTSEEYITYHNFAVTLQSRNFKIDAIGDLKEKSVEAFQQARFALGTEFELLAKENPEYSEIANQKLQIVKLFAKRMDVIVLDHRIFKYYLKQLKGFPGKVFKNVSFEESVTYHNIFEPSSYRMAFREAKLKDVFNKGLKKIQKSGRYREIVERYVKEGVLVDSNQLSEKL